MANDSILAWNEVALEANRVSHTDGSKEQNGPTLSSRALAIVHLAMYDAYAGVVNLGKPVKDSLPHYIYIAPSSNAPIGSTVQAAVSAAAFTTLSALYPSQLDYFKDRLKALGDPSNPGHGFGKKAGRAILKDRQNDPPAGQGNYQPSNGRGKHRVDPDNASQGFHGPIYGQAKLFASAIRHGLNAPPFNDGKDPDYLKALEQVRAKGIKPELAGTLPPDLQKKGRTPEEALIGTFWGYDGAAGLGTPPRLYNQIVRQIAIAKNNDEEKNARLFAFVNVAMADAGILAWEQKYRHEFWRPVVGIREHDPSLGPIDDGDPTPSGQALADITDPFWLPFGAPSSNSASPSIMTAQATFPFANAQLGRVKNFTPNFPAYPSGHATFGAAALHILRLFYGQMTQGPDKLFDNLFFVSDEMNDRTQDNNGTVRPLHRRNFPGGVWDMILENGWSRIFLGVHWSFDAFALQADGKTPDLSKPIGGVRLGLDIAEDIWTAGGKQAPKKP